MKKYILDANGNIKEEPDIERWGKWFEVGERVIDKTTVGDAEVSTVFLGLDHSFNGGVPILFETMIFGGKHDSYQERYATKELAQKGHDTIVEKLRNGTL